MFKFIASLIRFAIKLFVFTVIVIGVSGYLVTEGFTNFSLYEKSETYRPTPNTPGGLIIPTADPRFDNSY